MKVCKYGGEALAGDNHITYYVVGQDGETKSETYACRDHDQEHRVAKYLESGILTSALMTEAVLSEDRQDRVWEGKCPTKEMWFNRYMRELRAVEAVGKEWEQLVWFGGAEPHLDDERTHPYPGLGEPYRQYRQKPPGHNSHFCTDIAAVPEGSLQAFVIAARYKGYVANVGDIEYLSYSMCGRSIFQIGDTKTGHFVSFILDETSPSPRGGIRSIHALPDEAVAMFKQAITDWQQGKINLVQGDGVGFGF